MTDTYLKLGYIAGSVTEKHHQNWIALESVSFSVKRSLHVSVGRTDDRHGTSPQWSNLTLIKTLDKSSPKLIELACNSDVIPEAKIDVCHTKGSAYLQYTLHQVMVSEITPIVTGIMNAEAVRLSYTKMDVSYTPQDGKGQSQGPVRAGYNITAGELM